MVSPGMFRKILGAWLKFFLPGFHPWKHDDRKLIAEAERSLEADRGLIVLPPSTRCGRGTMRSGVEG